MINNETLSNFNIQIPGAPNFTYKEFIISSTAQRLNIDNTPSQYELNNIKRLAQNILQPLRNKFGPIRITSGFRCLRLNAALKSSPSSNHVKGEAADLEPIDPNISLIQILEYIHYNLPHRELIAEFFPDGWVHVAYREGDDSRILKLKDKSHNYSIVTLDYIKNLYNFDFRI